MEGWEWASRIIRAAWVSRASGSDVQHATFELFFCLIAAGNCWLQQGKNGRCQVLYMPGMSREECCRSGRLGTSWTEEDVPNSTLFRWMIFNGGAPNCIPCKGGGALISLVFLIMHNCIVILVAGTSLSAYILCVRSVFWTQKANIAGMHRITESLIF